MSEFDRMTGGPARSGRWEDVVDLIVAETERGIV